MLLHQQFYDISFFISHLWFICLMKSWRSTSKIFARPLISLSLDLESIFNGSFLLHIYEKTFKITSYILKHVKGVYDLPTQRHHQTSESDYDELPKRRTSTELSHDKGCCHLKMKVGYGVIASIVEPNLKYCFWWTDVSPYK